ncbi:MAG: MmgE/PrpD family protein [Peptococcaceae bacterium]|nr:MmgE/PrpD family protein [Peptococcaceae bacterium]
MMVTKTLARNIVNFPLADLPGETLHEAKRSFINWLGVCIGAHDHPSVKMGLQVAKLLGSSPQATLLGTPIKIDMQFAALLNGMSSHIFDFDDTLLDTVLHPSAPVLPAILAWCEFRDLPGRLFLESFVIGVEAEQRIAQAICPSHYQRGWHVTGTAGAFGAAAALGKLLALSEEKMIYALGLAATQSTGLREMFGTMTKPFHPGKAAANGLLAALLAREGFTSSLQSLEAKRGYLNVLSEAPCPAILEAPWGQEWQLMKNTYKPFACGIVTHPAIDAAIRLRKQGITAGDISEITLEVHPLVLELTGKPEPQDHLQAKFSVYHCTAVGLIDGAAGEWQFAESKVKDEEVVNLRRKIKAVPRDQLAEDQAILRANLSKGETVTVFVEHALGSLANPLSDEDLEDKFRSLTAPYLSKNKQEELIRLIWELESLPSLHRIIELCQRDLNEGVQ